MKKAIIFDLDGTLWDATGCSVDIWNRVFDKHKKTSMRMTQEISSSLMGKTMPGMKVRQDMRASHLSGQLMDLAKQRHRMR
ncbi:MAG: HAD hydrolase-like protein [Treponema sp.]|nr:HAD hydrolase-like protein [Treponema sp.]